MSNATREAYQTPELFSSDSFMPTDPDPTYHMIPTLARLQMRIALEAWHRRIPNYGLADDETILEHGGQFGLERLPLAWPL